ncbi:uncharacterized protein LOC108863707 [Galendromus occidentalis]|uniref:Uncharacterized protein LOC108863707 n=1 Tax=Galendromus occidentalis TaxID=34638 RepID=A0AAJ7L2G0_9ACAR|nr:uncharacterized protein LOC108863707 [Galendromus occidentalis]
MVKVQPMRRSANREGPSPSTPEKSIGDSGASETVSPEFLKKLAGSIESAQKMLAELLQKQDQLLSTGGTLTRERCRSEEQPESASLEPVESAPDSGVCELFGRTETPRRRRRQVSSSSEGLSHSADCQDLMRLSADKRPKIEMVGEELTAHSEAARRSVDTPERSIRLMGSRGDGSDGSGSDLTPFGGKTVPDQALEVSTARSEVDETYDIICPEETTILEGAPKSSKRIRSSAEIHKLLVHINLGHFPRKQTDFWVWHQRKVDGIFHREWVKSFYKSRGMAYLNLKSGTTLAFPLQ